MSSSSASVTPSSLPDLATAAATLVDIGRWVSARGWVPATAGNFSMRIRDGFVAVTRSGVDKGDLTPADILAVDLANPATAGTSAETPLHLAAYRALPDIGAVLHTHSLAATVLSRRHGDAGALTVEDYEVQKGIAGVSSHEGALVLPIYANSQDIPALADQVSASGGYQTPAHGFLLRGHGLYTWGRTAAEVRRHLVALEFLMECALEEERAR